MRKARQPRSRSPYGERGLKYDRVDDDVHEAGRSPYGERGLKLVSNRDLHVVERSLSLRRAWIEIFITAAPRSTHVSLSLRRAWIEISRTAAGTRRSSRSPYGERGLKYRDGAAS